MAIAKVSSGYETDTLLMDGTTAIKDLISDAAFTMTGTPTTATLLGATAPTISATAYTSCKIPTPFSAGDPLTIMCVVNTPWAGNDGVQHVLGITRTGDDYVQVVKSSDNKIYMMTRLAGSGGIGSSITVNATNWAPNTPHVVIGTTTANRINTIYLDGVAGASTTAGAREAAVGNYFFVGTSEAGGSPLNGSILCAIWKRVLSSSEIAALSNISAWSSLTDITVSGLASGNAVRVYNGTSVIDEATEAGGSVTLTPAGPQANRKLRVFEDNSYSTLIDGLESS